MPQIRGLSEYFSTDFSRKTIATHNHKNMTTRVHAIAKYLSGKDRRQQYIDRRSESDRRKSSSHVFLDLRIRNSRRQLLGRRKHENNEIQLGIDVYA